MVIQRDYKKLRFGKFCAFSFGQFLDVTKYACARDLTNIMSVCGYFYHDSWELICKIENGPNGGDDQSLAGHLRLMLWTKIKEKKEEGEGGGGSWIPGNFPPR